MKIKYEENKNLHNLEIELLNLKREKLKLRMQCFSAPGPQTFVLKKLRRQIASIKRVLAQGKRKNVSTE
ncbi:MAG: 50S ribosomal protein L29 [Candidatus Dasytiphilus stammeri]